MLTVQICSYRYTKHLSCLMHFSFFPLGLCAWTYKGVQIPPTQSLAVSLIGLQFTLKQAFDGNRSNCSTRMLDRLLCCTAFSQVQVLCVDLLDVHRRT